MPSIADLTYNNLLDDLGLPVGTALSTADLQSLSAGRKKRIGPRRYFSNRIYFPDNMAGTASVTPTLDAAYFLPFEIHDYVSINALCCEVTVAGAGSLISLGFYDSDNADGNRPKNRLAQVTGIDGNTVANVVQALGASLALSPGIYWGAFIINSGAVPTVRGYASHIIPHSSQATWNGVLSNTGYTQSGATGGLPAVTSSLGALSSNTPRIAIRTV